MYAQTKHFARKALLRSWCGDIQKSFAPTSQQSSRTKTAFKVSKPSPSLLLFLVSALHNLAGMWVPCLNTCLHLWCFCCTSLWLVALLLRFGFVLVVAWFALLLVWYCFLYRSVVVVDCCSYALLVLYTVHAMLVCVLLLSANNLSNTTPQGVIKCHLKSQTFWF